MDKEEWRPLIYPPGFEGRYLVSSLGRVKSIEHRDSAGKRRPSIIRKTAMSNVGYEQVILNKNGHKKTVMVHRIVAETFIGPRPESFVTCHNDGDKSNNRADNLRYDSASENSRDVLRHGRHNSQKSNLCKRGHLREGANAIPSGGKAHVKSCRACSNAISYKRKHPEVDLQEESDKRYAAIISETGWVSLNKMPPERKELLDYLVQDGTSINEIQRTMGVSRKTIRAYYPDYKPFEVGGGGVAASLRKAREVMDAAQIGVEQRV